jgi:ribosomal protein S18 acetylase RimI-like enzyme
MHQQVTLRPIAEDDGPLLFEIYASTRVEELAGVEWDEAQKAAFLRHQFEAQHQQYHEGYRDASFNVILLDGQPAGRLYLARGVDEIRIVDIAILPDFRGRGIGTGLITSIQADAAQAGKAVRIHVERFNPALRLYDRLGFRPIVDRGVYLFLEWTASPAASRQAAGSPR